MSLMAGFDLIVELSNETVLKLIRNTLTFEGQKLEPPFETAFTFASTASGSAHMVFTGVELDLLDNDTLTLTLPFKFGTIMLDAPITRAIGPLSGTLTMVAICGAAAVVAITISRTP